MRKKLSQENKFEILFNLGKIVHDKDKLLDPNLDKIEKIDLGFRIMSTSIGYMMLKDDDIINTLSDSDKEYFEYLGKELFYIIENIKYE